MKKKEENEMKNFVCSDVSHFHRPHPIQLNGVGIDLNNVGINLPFP